MNKKILALSMLVVSINILAATEKNEAPHNDPTVGVSWGDTTKPKYRVPASYELETTQKLTHTYQNFYRYVDEYNKEHGISKRYVEDFYGQIPKYSDNADLVPIWTEEIGSYDRKVEAKNPKYLSKETKDAYFNDKTKFSQFSKSFENGNEYRVYLGNHNVINKLEFVKEEAFENEKSASDIKYLVDGKYKLFKNGSVTYNTLEITEAEYNDVIKGKSQKDPAVLALVKSKLDNLGVSVEIDKGELYTTTDTGKKKRVAWNIYAASVPETPLHGEKFYQNTVITKVETYEKDANSNEMIYKKDGSIVIKDLGTSGAPAEPTLKFEKKKGWSTETVALDDTTEGDSYTTEIANDYREALEAPEAKKAEKLAAFKAKWDFKSDDELEATTQLREFKENVEAKAVQDKLFVEKTEKLGGEGDYYNPTLYYRWADSYSTPQDEKERIYNGTDEKAQKFIQENNMTLDEYKALLDDAKRAKEESDRLKYEGWDKESALGQDTSLKRFSTAKIKVEDKNMKRLEFGGQGRIDGIIDMGSGYNTIVINEDTSKYTGSFGTNIVFGSNLKLKNINTIGIGRQEEVAVGGSGLSGITSLYIEVDKNERNSEGHLVKHALKDTWQEAGDVAQGEKPSRIIFRKTKSFSLANDYRNDFVIALKTSDLEKDGEIIDMGRPLEYVDDLDSYNYKINLMADSPAQEVKVLDKQPGQKNDLVQINYKKEIEGFDGPENEIYRSLVNSNHMPALSETFTIMNKKTLFSPPEADAVEEAKNAKLVLALKDPKMTTEEILKTVPDFELSEEKREKIEKILDALTTDEISPEFTQQEKDRIETAKEKIAKYRGMSKVLPKYKKINTAETRRAIEKIRAKFAFVPEKLEKLGFPQSVIDSGEYVYSSQRDQYALDFFKEQLGGEDEVRELIKQINKEYNDHIKPTYEAILAARPNSAAGEEEIDLNDTPRQSLEKLKSLGNIDETTLDGGVLKDLVTNYRVYTNYLDKFDSLTEEAINEKMIERLQVEEVYKLIHLEIFNTRRQNEVLDEAKLIFAQLYDNNIYAKLNKITKNEMDVYAPIVLDNSFDFTSKKDQARGGAVSGRFARDKFKGTVYSAYGTYEKSVKDNMSAGVVVGGSNVDFHEIVNDDIRTVTTNSKIAGTSIYLGGFGRYQVKPNLEVVSGAGLQYGNYNVDREMKNHYQQEMFKGKVKNLSGSLYSGVVYTHKLNDSLDAHVKGMLAYTMVNQGKATEDGKPLSIEVKAQNFNYVDGQVGVGLTKTVYGENLKSSLSGTLSTVYGLVGYDNANLKGKFAGSTSDFGIKGESYDKQSVKLVLDYNVQHDAGLNYGLTGTYNKNSKENNISVGVKAGYKF